MARIILARATLEECGDEFIIWAEDRPDGGYEIHFQAPCDACQALAERIAAATMPGVPLHVRA